MNRREALKAVAVMSVGNVVAARTFKLEPSSRYVVFFDPNLVGPNFGKQTVLPPDTIFYSVDVPIGKSLDDAIRVFKESKL